MLCSAWITGADLTCDGSAGEKTSAALAASEILYELSGRQFSGLCTATVHPGERCGCACTAWPDAHPEWWDHNLRRAVWPERIRPWRTLLGYEPIVEVTEVIIAGDVLDPSAYEVDDRAWLVRVDCTAWPCDDDWSVSFTYGTVAPESGIRAAKALACELISLGAIEACGVGENVSSVTRIGVTETFDLASLLGANGQAGSRTGIRAVDLFLEAYNPEGLRGGSIMAVPGMTPAGRIVT